MEDLIKKLCTYVSEKESEAFYSNTGSDDAEWLGTSETHKEAIEKILEEHIQSKK